MRRTSEGGPFAILPPMPDKGRTLLWSEEADRILSSPLDRDELLELAKIASRVQIQALVQYGQAPSCDPRDEELMTAEEVSREKKCSLWSAREWFRRNRDKLWKPHPQATKGLRVKRAVVMKTWGK